MFKKFTILLALFLTIQLIHERNHVNCEIEFRKCMKNLCQNGGVCWLTENDYVVCSCPYPYYGSLCQLIRDTSLSSRVQPRKILALLEKNNDTEIFHITK